MSDDDGLPEIETSEAGIFTWEVKTDILYGDSAVAKHFGLDTELAARGLPLDFYLDRVHPDDRTKLVEAIKEAVSTQEPYHAEYRTLSENGAWSHMMAFGRCFFSANMEPASFSGIIYPVPHQAGEDESLIWHLLAAHVLAKKSGKSETATGILRLLSDLGLENIVAENDHRILN